MNVSVTVAGKNYTTGVTFIVLHTPLPFIFVVGMYHLVIVLPTKATTQKLNVNERSLGN